MEQMNTEEKKKQDSAKRGKKRCYIISSTVIFLLVLLVVLLVIFLVVVKDDDDDAETSRKTVTTTAVANTTTTAQTTTTTTTTSIPPVNKNFVIVDSKLGKVQGKIHKIRKDDNTSATVYEYRNIPYAVPPLKEMRWRAPVPLNASTSWNGILNYTTNQIWCKQITAAGILGTEDCLILTIRQPSYANKSNPLPVLFWIHGGGLIGGSSNWYYPTEECTASLGMVTVSINYRLNVFGFMSIKEMWTSNNTKEYGNFGILDMILALKWSKENILDFGGDANNIIILGQSGGAAAVFSLIASPAAQGLFKKAIAMSGYPISPIQDYDYADKRNAGLFLGDTKCNGSISDEVIRCLKNLSSDDLILNFPYFKHPLPQFSPWIFPFNVPVNAYPARVIDGNVIVEPIGSLKQLHTPGLEILIGNTAAEGNPVDQASTWEGFYQYLEPRINSFAPNLLNTTLLPLYRKRRNNKPLPANLTPQYIHQMMLSDVVFGCQTNDIVKNLSSIPNSKVYRYVASQPFSFNPFNDHPPHAHHSIDVEALFGFNYIGPHKHSTNPRVRPTVDDLQLVRNVRKMVKEFVFNSTTFEDRYLNSTIDFWDDKILTYNVSYHNEECNVLRENGFLRRAFGQLNK